MDPRTVTLPPTPRPSHLRLVPAPVQEPGDSVCEGRGGAIRVVHYDAQGVIVPDCLIAAAPVVDLVRWREEHSPHEYGYAQCTVCAETWLASRPWLNGLGPVLHCPHCAAGALFPVHIPSLPPLD